MNAPDRRRSGGDRIRRWLPALAWATFLIWLGGRRAGDVMAPPGFDKVAHFGLYFVLGALAGRAWRVDAAPNALLVLVLALTVGAGDELHQRGVPTRTADPLDFAADAAGVLLGFAALAARRWRISTE